MSRLRSSTDLPDPATVQPGCVLLASEGREIPQRAVEFAARLAKQGGGAVHVFSIARVWGTSLGLPNPGLMPSKGEWDAQRDLVAAAVKALKRQGIKAEGHVLATRKATKRIVSEAERLGYSRLTGSIIPSIMDFVLKIEPYPHDPARAKRLLAEAGYPGGFDGGDMTPLPPFTTMGEAVANDLAGVGIRTRVRTMERVTFLEAWRNKKLQGLIVNATAAQGNAASRLEAFVVTGSAYAYGGYPDIDDLFLQQAQERDRKKREALLHQIQRLIHERVMHAPIFEPATLHGVGPRVEEPAIGLNPLLYMAAPYEEMRLKKR